MTLLYRHYLCNIIYSVALHIFTKLICLPYGLNAMTRIRRMTYKTKGYLNYKTVHRYYCISGLSTQNSHKTNNIQIIDLTEEIEGVIFFASIR